MSDLELCNKVIDIIISAHKHAMPDNKSYNLRVKRHGDLVTDIDTMIQESISSSLLSLVPGSSVMAEEESSSNAISDLMWSVDPIDGTGNMVHGLPYSTSAALISNGSPVIGVVVSHIDGIAYLAASGCGAYKIVSDTKYKITVDGSCDNEGILEIGMPYNREHAHNILSITEKLYPMFADVKRIGPSSLDICRVADGTARAYVELDLMPWDIDAGRLILSEAGGESRKISNIFIAGNSNIIPMCIDRIN